MGSFVKTTETQTRPVARKMKSSLFIFFLLLVCLVAMSQGRGGGGRGGGGWRKSGRTSRGSRSRRGRSSSYRTSSYDDGSSTYSSSSSYGSYGGYGGNPSQSSSNRRYGYESPRSSLYQSDPYEHFDLGYSENSSFLRKLIKAMEQNKKQS